MPITQRWENEAIIVGADIPIKYQSDDMDNLCIGLLGDTNINLQDFDGGILFQCLKCQQISIHHYTQSYHCRKNGCYDGDGYLGYIDENYIRQAWFDAHLATRWNPR